MDKKMPVVVTPNGAYVCIKSMERDLTIQEQKEILNYCKCNGKIPIDVIADIFQQKFNTPITVTCIHTIIVKEALGHYG